MVKYVPEMESLGPGEGGDQMKSPILRGETVVNSELDILTSTDLAFKVAEVIGPERILAKTGGGTNLEAAAMTVRGGVSAYAAPKANVIRVLFKHPDPTIVQPVLRELIDQYFVKHYEVHRALANLEQFERERDQVRMELGETERKLRDLMKSEAVFSPDDAKKAAAAEVESTQKALRDARMELAQLQALLRLTPTNALPEKTQAPTELNVGKRMEYGQLSAQLDQLRAREQVTIAQGYTVESAMVKPLRQKMAELEAQREDMEREYPELAGLALSSEGAESLDPLTNRRKVEFLNIKIATSEDRLQRARADEAKLYAIADQIAELERQKEMEEEHFRYFSTALDRVKFDSALGSSRDSNISRVQHPSPPISDIGSLFKQLLMVAGGGIFVGVALALLIELFFDQRVKRPIEIRRLIQAPLYLSIPSGARNGERKRLLLANSKPQKERDQGGARQLALMSDREHASDGLQPYFEALRDRILNRFETLARKPKLVGVCGCAGAAGNVTRLAAGLAGALSEAGDLKVLLVDMKNRSGKPHPILGSRRSCSLTDALQHQNQGEALIAPNLYMASAQGTDSQQFSSSPSKFTRVVPQLNASDYDYIVFDMPEVNQISITPRLAKHMDLMLLVVEAEQAHRTAVKQAGSLLTEFTSNVAVVLNNTKASLPRSLQHTA